MVFFRHVLSVIMASLQFFPSARADKFITNINKICEKYENLSDTDNQCHILTASGECVQSSDDLLQDAVPDTNKALMSGSKTVPCSVPPKAGHSITSDDWDNVSVVSISHIRGVANVCNELVKQKHHRLSGSHDSSSDSFEDGLIDFLSGELYKESTIPVRGKQSSARNDDKLPYNDSVLKPSNQQQGLKHDKSYTPSSKHENLFKESDLDEDTNCSKKDFHKMKPHAFSDVTSKNVQSDLLTSTHKTRCVNLSESRNDKSNELTYLSCTSKSSRSIPVDILTTMHTTTHVNLSESRNDKRNELTHLSCTRKSSGSTPVTPLKEIRSPLTRLSLHSPLANSEESVAPYSGEYDDFLTRDDCFCKFSASCQQPFKETHKDSSCISVTTQPQMKTKNDDFTGRNKSNSNSSFPKSFKPVVVLKSVSCEDDLTEETKVVDVVSDTEHDKSFRGVNEEVSNCVESCKSISAECKVKQPQDSLPQKENISHQPEACTFHSERTPRCNATVSGCGSVKSKMSKRHVRQINFDDCGKNKHEISSVNDSKDKISKKILQDVSHAVSAHSRGSDSSTFFEQITPKSISFVPSTMKLRSGKFKSGY